MLSLMRLGHVALLCSLSATIWAAHNTYYCKCACGKNSTILELQSPSKKACLDCTKQFCQDNLPDLCLSDVSDSEIAVSTECFSRQSTKDEIIVIAFLVLTGGLLVYATFFKTLIERRAKLRDEGYSNLGET